VESPPIGETSPRNKISLALGPSICTIFFLMKSERIVLKLEGIAKTYGPRAVLKDISLEVRAGERFFIIPDI